MMALQVHLFRKKIKMSSDNDKDFVSTTIFFFFEVNLSYRQKQKKNLEKLICKKKRIV